MSYIRSIYPKAPLMTAAFSVGTNLISMESLWASLLLSYLLRLAKYLGERLDPVASEILAAVAMSNGYDNKVSFTSFP
jgi:hypothetical protein